MNITLNGKKRDFAGIKGLETRKTALIPKRARCYHEMVEGCRRDSQREEVKRAVGAGGAAIDGKHNPGAQASRSPSGPLRF